MADSHSLGEYCADVEVFEDNLLTKLPTITDKLTNGVVVEICRYIQSSKRVVSWQMLADALNSAHPQNSVSTKSFRTAFVAVAMQKTKLRKHCDAQKVFLNTTFKTPVVNLSSDSVEPAPLPAKRQHIEIGVIHCDQNELRERVAHLEMQRIQLEKNNMHQQAKIRHLQRNLAIRLTERKTILRRMHHKQTSASLWKIKYLRLKQFTTGIQSNLSAYKNQCSSLRELRRTKKRAVTKHQSAISGHNKKIFRLKDELTKMETELDAVKEQSKEGESTALRTKVDGKSYSPWVRESSYHLQNLGVSKKNTSEAIRCVQAASSLEVVGSLPSRSTQVVNKRNESFIATTGQGNNQ